MAVGTAPIGLNATTMNAVVGVILLALAAYLGVQCLKSARRAPSPAPVTT